MRRLLGKSLRIFKSEVRELQNENKGSVYRDPHAGAIAACRPAGVWLSG